MLINIYTKVQYNIYFVVAEYKNRNGFELMLEVDLLCTEQNLEYSFYYIDTEGAAHYITDLESYSDLSEEELFLKSTLEYTISNYIQLHMLVKLQKYLKDKFIGYIRYNNSITDYETILLEE